MSHFCIVLLFIVIFNKPLDIQVNGQLIGDKKTENNQKITTYFGKFGLENRKINLRISVTTEVITIFYNKDKTIIPWSTTATVMNERYWMYFNNRSTECSNIKLFSNCCLPGSLVEWVCLIII